MLRKKRVGRPTEVARWRHGILHRVSGTMVAMSKRKASGSCRRKRVKNPRPN